jgi:plastocyanin
VSVPVNAGRARGAGWLAWVPLVLGAAVAVGVYAWAKSVNPDPATSLFGSTGTDTFEIKAWLATGVLALAAVQVLLALRLYGKIGGGSAPPRRLGLVHRMVGVLIIVLTLPVAYHCLFAYGFRDLDTRTVVHSIAGCFLYGAIVAKVFIVQSRRLPGWELPVAGGTLVVIVVALWYSSALWYFKDYNASGSAPATTGYGAIAMKDIQFSPKQTSVKVGQKVTWTNDDVVDHNVTATSGATFKSKDFGKGGTFSYTPTKPGKIDYVCTLHPGMDATLTVTR